MRIPKFCTLCGAENPVNAKHCEACGSPFEESSIKEVDEQYQKKTRIKEGSDGSDSSDSSGGSDSSDSSDSSGSSDGSNASVSKPLAYVLSFSLMFLLAILYSIIFY